MRILGRYKVMSRYYVVRASCLPEKMRAGRLHHNFNNGRYQTLQCSWWDKRGKTI